MSDRRAVDVRVLGPLGVRVAGESVAVPGAKPRALLTVLGLNPGTLVASNILEAVLWGDDPPRTAHKALQTHVSILRRSLGEDVVVTHRTGWQLSLPSTDASDFEATARAARDTLRGGDAMAAAKQFDQALDLWRGLPELPMTPRGQAELTRWTEAHASVVDDRVDALLAGGHAADVIGGLESAIADEPLRERRWAQLCLALYRAGRQGDALEAYRRARTVLAEELGMEPGPELRRLEMAILTHDESLDVHPGRPQSGPPERGAATQPAAAPPDRAATPEPSVSAASVPAASAISANRTTLIGRRTELDQLSSLLSAHRLVTIIGPAGVGKTRLALVAADAATPDFPGGVHVVDLAPISPEFVVPAVARAAGIIDNPERPPEVALYAQLGRRSVLLVLDNCEHLIETVSSFVERLAASCPHTVVLATSRERLAAIGEHVVTVPPLALVDPETGGPKGSEAETLFLERARAVEPEFDADAELVIEICARCDGLPLAIELAAARCASLGIDGLRAGLDDRLRLLTGSRVATERHRSLRAVLDWSYNLLEPDEQTVFRRLGVFAGWFDLDAAVTIAGAAGVSDSARVVDLVGRLTEKSLLAHQHNPRGSRWRMLEVIRSYAAQQLAASGDGAAVQSRYLLWASATATRLDERLAAGQTWRSEFDLVATDLRAALARPLDQRPPTDDQSASGDQTGRSSEQRGAALALALALGRLEARTGAFTDAARDYETAMSLARTTGDANHLARAALGASNAGMLFGITQASRVALVEEALAAQGAEPDPTRVKLQSRLATELYWSPDHDRSHRLVDEAMSAAEQLADPSALAYALYAQHYVTRGPGDWERRLHLADRLMRCARQSGETQLELAGMAAHTVDLMESGDLTGMDASIAALEVAADRLDHPEFRWYAAMYRLVRALVAGRFDDADDLADLATTAAERAPEFSVGLYFAESVTDLRKLDEPGLLLRAARLRAMASRFPHVLVWRCLAVLNDLSRGDRASARAGAADLVHALLSQQVKDGHWLVGCCLLAEAVAELPDVELAEPLLLALRPFGDNFAVAGRVGAFRGSVWYPLGLLALATGDADQAARDLTAAVEAHERIDAGPFHRRSVTALERARRGTTTQRA
jgi:predicted ATPase/DNA-binding SARP family transcriptional activator